MQFEKAVAKASALTEDPREMNATLHRSGCWRTEAAVCDVPDQAEPGGVDQDATSSGSLRMDAVARLATERRKRGSDYMDSAQHAAQRIGRSAAWTSATEPR